MIKRSVNAPSLPIEVFGRDRDFAGYAELVDAQRKAKRKYPILVTGLCEGAEDAFLISSVKRSEGTSLIVCANERECRKKAESLKRFGLRAEFYITRDLNFYNIIASRDYEHERLKVLYGIVDMSLDAVVTTPDALLGYTISPEDYEDSLIRLSFGEEYSLQELCDRLVTAGYARTDTVESIGQFALRGGILDIFPAFFDGDGKTRNNTPIRIEFFGDEVDRMVSFDPESQRSVDSLDRVTVPPAKELIITQEKRERIEKEISAQIKRARSPQARETLRTELSECRTGGEINFADKYITSVIPLRTTLLDYLTLCPCAYFIGRNAIKERLDASVKRIWQDAEDMIENELISDKNADYTAPESRIESFKAGTVCVNIDSFSQSGGGEKLGGYISFRTRHTASYEESYPLLKEDIDGYMSQAFSVAVISENESTALSLCNDLENDGYIVSRDGELRNGAITVIYDTYVAPFELSSSKFVVLSTLPGERRARPGTSVSSKVRRNRGGADKISAFTELKEGDYVVHENYGIGVYCGIEKMTSNGVTKDYINLKYAGTDRLYIPTDKIDRISKYIGGSSDDMNVKLSKLGTNEWSKTTAKAKASAKEMAKDLIKLYAARSRKPGFAFPPDDDYQQSFDSAFEYEETSSQLEAIDDIKADMQLPRPMDRLLCGDVGFGKTEIALRAAYKAILGGKQVALLVPTTILALQHFNTALARMRPFLVNIEMLSRFRTPKQQAEIIRRVRRGEIDLLIGTHRLLSKDIEFSDLGLLIVDEEQRFGVKQKERIKQMTENIDVLTLTATPIPRTLNMALGGIRDISVLDEAPGERLPIQTYVLEHDDAIIEDAIRRELRRGGQVFYLFNTVDTISSVAKRLSERIPEARIVYAHGKMEKEELEKIWAEMIMGEIDILISTTIIETGVDVPNANTLIVENAQNLGLSQLHQLRGRVGRSARRAYAYFTFPQNRALSEIASKRLGAIKEYAQFGAGFKIAMRDLEIRGAGNLLGSEQHGHLNAVGYELFIKLLKDAVLEEQGQPTKTESECIVNLDFDAFLPEKYVNSPASRMSLYKKIALIRTKEDISDITDELCDRFGDIPKAADNLIYISYMRAMASKIGLKNIKGDAKNVYITFDPETFNFDVWMDLADDIEKEIRLSITSNDTLRAQIKKAGDTIDLINKMFEKYFEILKNHT